MSIPLLRRGIRLDIDFAIQCQLDVRSIDLKEAARAFTNNIEISLSLPSLPNILLQSAANDLWVKDHVLGETIELIRSKRGSVSDREIQDLKEKQTAIGHEKIRESGALQRRLRERGNKRLNELLEVPQIRKATDASVHAAIINAWTSFETLALDAWEAAVTARPEGLGARARQALTSKMREKVARKTAGDLGPILSQGFRFRSLDAIQTSFKAIFDYDDDAEMLFDKDLRESGETPEHHIKVLTRLEATRHLLVHRAGIVDELFKEQTKSPVQVGSVWRPVEGELASLLNVSVYCGCALLRFVDRQLES